MALSTKPLSGMRQRLPQEFRVEKYVTEILCASSTQAGFEEYDGPVIEPLGLFAAKSGVELVGRQSYCFTDRGGREVILRLEMTPSLLPAWLLLRGNCSCLCAGSPRRFVTGTRDRSGADISIVRPCQPLIHKD